MVFVVTVHVFVAFDVIIISHAGHWATCIVFLVVNVEFVNTVVAGDSFVGNLLVFVAVFVPIVVINVFNVAVVRSMVVFYALVVVNDVLAVIAHTLVVDRR